MNKNYKLTIAYDGSRYRGWQRLKNDDKSIQYKIEQVLSKLYDREIKIIGSGRTDAGVHAENQIANFHAEASFTIKEIKNYLNHYLPEDIAIKSIEEVSSRFHSRFNVKEKHYRYRIWIGNYPNVFERKYMYSIDKTIDINAMRIAAKLFEGTHDFKGFSTKSKKKNTQKTISKINIIQNDNEITIDYYGNGFLYNMLRIITGTLLELGYRTRSIDTITQIFETKDRKLAGPTVPPQGLCLINVKYKH